MNHFCLIFDENHGQVDNLEDIDLKNQHIQMIMFDIGHHFFDQMLNHMNFLKNLL